MYAKHCHKQLDRICQTGAKRGLKGPSVEEIHSSLVSKSDLKIQFAMNLEIEFTWFI